MALAFKELRIYLRRRRRTTLPQKREQNQEEGPLLAALGTEAHCCTNSSFRSHNHWSLRFLKLFLLPKDARGKAGKPALNVIWANHLLHCSIYTEKPLKYGKFINIKTRKCWSCANRKATLCQKLVSEQGISTAFPQNVQIFKNRLFNECFLCSFQSANLKLQSVNYSFDCEATNHASHHDDRKLPVMMKRKLTHLSFEEFQGLLTQLPIGSFPTQVLGF